MMPSYRPLTIKQLKEMKYDIIDLQSDTKSLPTKAMRESMLNAEVGDDVSDEDPTCNLLQERVAELFKKESAIFLPSGTLGNMIAILAHCDRRGCEIICGDQSHTFLYEQGGPAQLGGVHTRTLKNLPDGTFDLKELVTAIRVDDLHAPVTSLVIVENTHNMCGGRVLPMPWLKELAAITKQYKIPLHMDGARIFNASIKLSIPVSEMTKDFASVQFCFSKGLGAPVGSMLVGSKELIFKAKRLRKVFGSGMRQVGVLAAPCLVALDTMITRLADDHQRAAKLALAIASCNSPYIQVDATTVETNILMVKLNSEKMSAPAFCSRLTQVTDQEKKSIKPILIRICPRNQYVVRMVVYHNITDEDIDNVIAKIMFIIKELNSS